MRLELEKFLTDDNKNGINLLMGCATIYTNNKWAAPKCSIQGDIVTLAWENLTLDVDIKTPMLSATIIFDEKREFVFLTKMSSWAWIGSIILKEEN